MDKRLDRLEDKIDSMISHQSRMETLLGKQAVILEEHVRRTNLLEEKIKPLEKHVVVVNALVKAVIVIASIGGVHGLLRMLKVY